MKTLVFLLFPCIRACCELAVFMATGNGHRNIKAGHCSWMKIDSGVVIGDG